MEHQFRRGIYRPNAQRLSISLAPLVAQRSLLFRVKADLATKTSYGQLTPMTDESDSNSESPALFLLTPTGQVMSAAQSARSTASVYSQDSWRGPDSPFIPVINMDTRRHAIAFSPSLQWSDLSEADLDVYVAEKPRCSAPLSALSTVAFQEDDVHELGSMASTVFSTEIVAESPFLQNVPVLNSQEMDTAIDVSKLKKKKLTEVPPKRASKHSKAFGRVMSRLSLQPSKKDLADRRRTEIAIHPMPQLPKLPELQMADPIRMSFISKSSTPATVEVQPTIPEEEEMPKKTCELVERPAPLTPFSVQGEMLARTPVAALSETVLVQPMKKGHRRYRSSPAIMNFDFRGWDTANMPPLPTMPSSLKAMPAVAVPQVPLRGRSRSVMGTAPGPQFA